MWHNNTDEYKTESNGVWDMLTVDNLIDLKYKNLKSIIDYVRFREYNTKKQIAHELNLSFATVSNMINLLMNAGLIKETEARTSKYVGRFPKFINLNHKRFYIISLDLHLDWCMSLCLIDLARNIISRKTYEAQPFDDVNRLMERVKEVFDDFLGVNGIDPEMVIGAGIIMRGILNEQSDYIVVSENKLFQNQPIKKFMREAIRKPIVMENDTNLAAYFSAISMETDNLMYVYMGEGLGFGIITGGNILRGVRGYSSEIDHIPMGKLHKKCPHCGNYDCLHTDVSRNGFLTKYYEKDYEFKRSYKDEWEEYTKRIRSGDTRAVEVASENAVILGKALATAASITWPEKVVIGGIPQELYQVMGPVVEREINSRKPFEPYITVKHDDQCYDTIAKGAAEMMYFQWLPDFE